MESIVYNRGRQTMTATQDPRTDEMRREMAQHFDNYAAAYRDEEWCSVAYEDEDCVVIADHKGHEFSEWQSEFGGRFSEIMHTVARAHCDHSWAADYPVVFDKLE